MFIGVQGVCCCIQQDVSCCVGIQAPVIALNVHVLTADRSWCLYRADWCCDINWQLPQMGFVSALVGCVGVRFPLSEHGTQLHVLRVWYQDRLPSSLVGWLLSGASCLRDSGTVPVKSVSCCCEVAVSPDRYHNPCTCTKQ